MRMCSVRVALVVVPLALAGGCAHRESGGASSARLASGGVAPCPVPAGAADSTAWERVDAGVFAYRVPAWSPDPGPALAPGDDAVTQRFHATLGGRRANVWRFRQGGLHRASAEWSGAPRVWLRVETELAGDDELPTRILRSVRFPTR